MKRDQINLKLGRKIKLLLDFKIEEEDVEFELYCYNATVK